MQEIERQIEAEKDDLKRVLQSILARTEEAIAAIDQDKLHRLGEYQPSLPTALILVGRIQALMDIKKKA